MQASRFPLIDTDPHPRLRVYSASNFAEVAPARLSILSWSLVGEPTERATRALAARLWPRASWHTGSHYVFVGYFACRPYHNLSAYVRLGSDLLGVGPADVTAGYFESTPHDDIPVHSPSLPRRLAVAPRMAREIAALRSRAMRVAEMVDELEGMVDTLARMQSSIALGRAYVLAMDTVDAAWMSHISTTASLVPLRAVLGRVARHLDVDWEQTEGWIVRTGELVWDQYIGDGQPDLRSGEFLLHPFYELLCAQEPWSGYARPSSMPVEPSATSIIDEHARAFWGMLDHRRGHVLRPLAQLATDAMATRERTKSLMIRALHATRRLLPHLAAAHGMPESAIAYLRYAELDGSIGRDELADLATQRARESGQALSQPMPNRLDFAKDLDVLDDGPTVDARGISPGRVVGFVVRDSSEIDPARNNIFVVDAADADVQSVLPRLHGLLARRGSELSHIAILAREQGVPAVVGHTLADTLRSGEQIVLDGSTGEVAALVP